MSLVFVVYLELLQSSYWKVDIFLSLNILVSELYSFISVFTSIDHCTAELFMLLDLVYFDCCSLCLLTLTCKVQWLVESFTHLKDHALLTEFSFSMEFLAATRKVAY